MFKTLDTFQLLENFQMNRIFFFAFVVVFISLQCDGKYYLVNTKDGANEMSSEQGDEIPNELLEQMKADLGDEEINLDKEVSDYQAAKKKKMATDEGLTIGDDYVLPEKQKKKMLNALKKDGGRDYYGRH